MFLVLDWTWCLLVPQAVGIANSLVLGSYGYATRPVRSFGCAQRLHPLMLIVVAISGYTACGSRLTKSRSIQFERCARKPMSRVLYDD